MLLTIIINKSVNCHGMEIFFGGLYLQQYQTLGYLYCTVYYKKTDFALYS